MKNTKTTLLSALVMGSIVGSVFAADTTASTAMPNKAALDTLAAKVVKESFRDEGIVKTSVLDTDQTNRECSDAEVMGKPLKPARAKAIEKMNLKTIQWPKDGKFLGDWKKGEALAQSGRGLTWTDKEDTPNGGNCYNCHQIDKKEISFGSIGPSLYNYGKLRGVTDPASPEAKAIVQYTWGKIWNSRAYNACSHMPRAGHAGILTPAQIADIMALLLDPQSPVNQ